MSKTKCQFSKEQVNGGNGKVWKKPVEKKSSKLTKKKKYKWHKLIGMTLLLLKL